MFALAGAPCGCSPLLPFCGGVSLPGGATYRDNPEQAKTVPGLIGRLLLRRNSRTLTRHATVVLESLPRADAGLFLCRPLGTLPRAALRLTWSATLTADIKRKPPGVPGSASRENVSNVS